MKSHTHALQCTEKAHELVRDFCCDPQRKRVATCVHNIPHSSKHIFFFRNLVVFVYMDKNMHSKSLHFHWAVKVSQHSAKCRNSGIFVKLIHYSTLSGGIEISAGESPSSCKSYKLELP